MSNLAKAITCFLAASCLLSLPACSQRRQSTTRPSLAAPLATALAWSKSVNNGNDEYTAKRSETVVGSLAYSPEGWHVIEPGGTSLGGPYATVEQAKQRAERVFRK